MKAKNLLLRITIWFIISLPSFTFAQNLLCAGQLGGTSSDHGQAIALDASGNTYVTGDFTGTADFDPGIAIFNLTSAGNSDVFITKLDGVGNLLWAKQIGGANMDIGYSATVDAFGSVYTTGFFSGTVDFDPGIGVFNLTSTGGPGYADIFISKLDASGNFLWAKRMGGAANGNTGTSVILDASGNVYTTGGFTGTSDFDPGIGVFNLTSAGLYDIFISKLDAAGNFVWAKTMGGSSTEFGLSMKIDASGNLYTTGYFAGTVDFDPGIGIFNITSLFGSRDVFISKLDANGNFVWAKTMGGSGMENGNGISVDASGNIYTVGIFEGTADFDPGIGVFNLTSAGLDDIFISKLDAAGNFVWAKAIGQTANDIGKSIALDASGNVYTTGHFTGTVDFDLGPGIFNLTTPAGSIDVFILKLDSSGNFVWAKSLSGPSSETANSIAIDAAGNVDIVGSFVGPTDFEPGPGVFNLTSFGPFDVFVHKMLPCTQPNLPTAINGATTACIGVANSYSIALVPGATSYSWSLPSGWSGSGSINSTSLTISSSGIFGVTASNTCGISSMQTLSVTLSPNPTITVNSGSICLGNSFTMIPNGANTYSFSGGSAIVSPTANTSYSVTGTSTAGCVSSTAAISHVTVNALPLPTITVNSGSICSGTSFTMNPTGANTYTFSGGSAIVSPTANTSYSVTGTNIAGCVSATNAVANITVNALPIIAVSSGSLCLGNSFTINPTGANTYTFSSGLPIVSPTVTTTYSVAGTDVFGCIGATICNVNVASLPAVNIIASNSLICANTSVSLTASGAVTYTWNSGNTNAIEIITPSITTNYTLTGTDANGCTNISVFTQSVSLCTGINSKVIEQNIKIYPNPNNGNFSIELNEPAQIIIYNTLGQIVYDETKSDLKNDISLSGFAKGAYFIKIEFTTATSYYTKIIKSE